MEKILELEDLKAYYQTLKGNVKALDGITFNITRGEILGLAGESGCGKTTLGKTLINRKAPLNYISGKIKFRGRDLAGIDNKEMNRIRFKDLAMIPQAAMNSFSPTRKIRRFIIDLVCQHGIVPGRAFFKKVIHRLAMVNLDPVVLDQYPIELSGGMKQRLMMVITTLLGPDLLIADEITSALDVTSQRFVAQILVEYIKKDIIGSVLFITHDLSILSQIADRIVIMYAGHIAEAGPADEIIGNPKHPYTRAFVSSLPRIGTRYQQKILEGIRGTPPLLLEIKEGCRFWYRCHFKKDVCREKTPGTEFVNENHSLACHYWKKLQEGLYERNYS